MSTELALDRSSITASNSLRGVPPLPPGHRSVSAASSGSGEDGHRHAMVHGAIDLPFAAACGLPCLKKRDLTLVNWSLMPRTQAWSGGEGRPGPDEQDEAHRRLRAAATVPVRRCYRGRRYEVGSGDTSTVVLDARTTILIPLVTGEPVCVDHIPKSCGEGTDTAVDRESTDVAMLPQEKAVLSSDGLERKFMNG